MLEKKEYNNGNKVYELKDDILTYYFKNCKVKAQGKFINSLMEEEWYFYRETGQLWQIGNFKNGKKHGTWKRFDRNNNIEYSEKFIKNMIVKKSNNSEN